MIVTVTWNLAEHAGHRVEITPVDTLVCLTCSQVLVEFGKASRNVCWRCEVGTLETVLWLPDAAADSGMYIEECDNCGLVRRTETILPDDDEWAREQEEEE